MMDRVNPASTVLTFVVCCLFSLACEQRGRGDTAVAPGQFEVYLRQHHYGTVRLDSDSETNIGTVEVKVNGRRLNFFVDSGTPRTTLTAECAKHLKLDVRDTGHTTSGVGGTIEGDEGIALIQSFTMGDFEINRTNTIFVFPRSAHVMGGLDGVLGLDFMQLNDLIYPVGGTGFLLKPGPTPVVSIATYMAQLGFKPIPLSFRSGHLIVNGHLNNRPMNAVVDTGAAFSTFDSAYVHALLGHAIPSLPISLSGFDGRVPDEYRFTPTEMDLEGFQVPPVMIVSSNAPMFSKDEVTGLLGVDLLATHRAIIDLGSDTLWLK
jgi:hypothetical protein